MKTLILALAASLLTGPALATDTREDQSYPQWNTGYGITATVYGVKFIPQKTAVPALWREPKALEAVIAQDARGKPLEGIDLGLTVVPAADHDARYSYSLAQVNGVVKPGTPLYAADHRIIGVAVGTVMLRQIGKSLINEQKRVVGHLHSQPDRSRQGKLRPYATYLPYGSLMKAWQQQSAHNLPVTQR